MVRSSSIPSFFSHRGRFTRLRFPPPSSLLPPPSSLLPPPSSLLPPPSSLLPPPSLSVHSFSSMGDDNAEELLPKVDESIDNKRAKVDHPASEVLTCVVKSKLTK
ncbi:hypothetical protein PRIPAC_86968 [Pristionchus pacificus]|uniref:Uncharacterized protein n=1 Tax=Pristionchus pacificus TaxID=54126 RepID=A0A2A6C4Y7_PRIPA|nr:hypothetical protein PRIPAC_86968 [Pristionchus pacificus]|eukprot:PDM73176.1 hypothetical protein PRIPAC_43272 [Pristionchus pacificus]